MELSMGYELLHTQKVISVSHRFAENAGKMGSKEYALLMHLRKDYPDYAVRPRKNKEAKSHQTYGRLRYQKMAEWILHNRRCCAAAACPAMGVDTDNCRADVLHLFYLTLNFGCIFKALYRIFGSRRNTKTQPLIPNNQ